MDMHTHTALLEVCMVLPVWMGVWELSFEALLHLSPGRVVREKVSNEEREGRWRRTCLKADIFSFFVTVQPQNQVVHSLTLQAVRYIKTMHLSQNTVLTSLLRK